MCGRYSITGNGEAMRRVFALLERPSFPPNCKVAPTQMAPVVRLGEDGQGHLAMLRRGLIPSWAKDADIGHRMIDARAETVAEKPAFRAAVPGDAGWRSDAVSCAKPEHDS